MNYLAHSANDVLEVDLLKTHLQKVADRAAEYADRFGVSSESYLAGLLHDMGKYGDLFQKRLKGEITGIDHWSTGAWAALTKYKLSGIAAALAIQGHHIGLRQASKDSLQRLNPERLKKIHPMSLTLSDPDVENLLRRMKDDGLVLPPPDEVDVSIYEHSDSAKASRMLDVRMLFSALVDADFIETEAHFKAIRAGTRAYREAGLSLNPDLLLEQLLLHIEHLANEPNASASVNKMRSDLLHACLDAAANGPGLFTLTAPTGTGKTFSMLAFALKHASCNNLDRIITVIPYLSIIDQTAQEYRHALESAIGSSDIRRFILEHHSLAGTHSERKDGSDKALEIEQDSSYQERLLAENWDAPIVVTTSVQFLESLFSNRPSSCRKLHRIAKSVILFDEVQTLPVGLAIPTLATLSRLSERYGTSVLFATATQPAFPHLDTHVRRFCAFGWQPREIVPSNLDLFSRAKRTRIEWPEDLSITLSWEEIATELSGASCEQVLCIVNLKKHALALYQTLLDMGTRGLCHLSTNMCPAHRQAVLQEVRSRLKSNKPCRLISTQCVEAGVDVDFPRVFRALGPLDAIAQAAGRCNRNGLSESGEVVLFMPESDGRERIYPDDAYRQATGITRILLAKHGTKNTDIDSPQLFAEYYQELYDIAKPETSKKDLLNAMELLDFEGVSSNYRVIEKGAINILVPYDHDRFKELVDEIRKDGLTGRWMAKARPHTVGFFRPRIDDPVRSYIEPAPLGKDSYSDEWFIYLFSEHYSLETGLNPPQSMECFIA